MTTTHIRRLRSEMKKISGTMTSSTLGSQPTGDRSLPMTDLDHCPTCFLDWRSARPVKIHGAEAHRCVGCKAVYRTEMLAARALLAACQEFVCKVDAGEARSTRSYAQMKTAIAKATTGLVDHQSSAEAGERAS